jgi:hypothetical protein
MSIKGKIIELIVFNILKWCVIIIFAGIVLYFIMPKYEMLADHRCFNRVTGKIHELKNP